jgi:hypothetical protein
LLTRSKPTEIIAFIGPFPRGRAQFHFMPDKFHYMPDEFHYMPDKFHLMPDPTQKKSTRNEVVECLLNERSFSIMQGC